MPQVNVLINDIASKCLTNCDFEWINVIVRPQVTFIDTSALPDIIITGTNFDTNPANNIVMIGSYMCVVYQVTETEIQCRADDNIPAGQYNFTVAVTDKVR